MARIRTVDFLPEIFQTPANRQVLGATLDQLTQEPKFEKTQGYVGRKIGPGVNPNDKYVIEPTKGRNDYQLEPGVISIEPDTNKILDAITYPGLNDALKLQGADIVNADRLYNSEYYSWDPFVDFDKLVNFSQYYWLPLGPDPVSVSATVVPLTNSVTVTRANGVYKFSGVEGNNPVLTLVRGGNYQFQVAQNSKETINYRVTNNATSAYVIDYQPNPTLTLVRGNTYTFDLTLTGLFPFWIKTEASLGTVNPYNTGVLRNGANDGTVTFTVPQDAPDTLYYSSATQFNMRGQINVVNGTSGTGPGFWIQAEPGVSGTLPYSPNISSRTVLGVTNNGEDLGTVRFDVPLSTAQNFYYGLTSIGTVDLVTNLQFNQINNQFVTPFLAANPTGIDGITNLDGRTVIFLNQVENAQDGGWQITTQIDPLTPSTFTNVFGSQAVSSNFVTYNNLSTVGISGIGTGMVVSASLNANQLFYNNTNIHIVVENPGVGYAPGDQLKITGDQLGGTTPANDLFFTVATVGQTGLVGSFDTTTFDQTTDITTQFQRYSVWQINYVTTTDGTQYMRLTSIEDVNNLEKFSILFGDQYANTQWYKNAEGYFEQIPLLTAVMDTLWYQDGTDPEIFGQIRLINQSLDTTLDIDEIIGQTQYTSPNGVVFTNGLLVTFQGNVEPASYQNNSYYVEGVGSAIQLLPFTNFVTPETYTDSETIPYDSVPYDVGNFDATLNAPVVPDYLTINRASPDLNPWSRSNRWFHIDVINASADYNNLVPAPDNAFRARRPILEFRAGTKLFNFGTEGKQPIDVIDFSVTDVLSNINGTTGVFDSEDLIEGYTYTISTLGTTDWNAVAGTTGIDYAVGDYITVVSAEPGTGIAVFSIDGYELLSGSRVIFAGDDDELVRNKIYQVEYIIPDTVPPVIAQPIINLTPASDANVLINQSVVCLSGATLQGVSFYYDGVDWIETQQKTGVNQAPLFDVYDASGIVFSNQDTYPSTTFTGSKLFSYAVGSGVNDETLGFPLRYLSLANVGDIVFENNLYKDTFIYVKDSNSNTVPVSSGFVRQYSDRVNFVKEIGWQTAVTRSLTRQQFQFVYDGSPLKLDINVVENNVVPAVQLFVGSIFQDPSNYTVETTNTTTTITLTTAYIPGDVIEALVLSDQISKNGFYQVPINLEDNPLNENSEILTLGTIRTHYGTIAENLINLQGPINGANNTRDLGNIVPYGLQILQQSSPLTLAGYFMRTQEYDIFGAIEYNNREYIKFKSQLLETVARTDYGTMSVASILDSAIAEITRGRTEINPFYWSDMMPTGSVYTDTVTIVNPITTSTFSTIQTYDFTSANYLGLLVYVTRLVDNVSETTLLKRGSEYTVATDGPRLTVLVPLSIGEVVTIREYTSTVGNFVPNTPTKLGLYPKYDPIIFYDTTYLNPTLVIQGHDGSITVAFNDIRDQVLLEFEKRIYDNLKTDDNPVPLTFEDVAPGFFRTTNYTQTEITNILSESFLSWIGWNKIDYKTQDYQATNSFTYNYSSSGNRINEQPLLGAWRGIYRYFYDTEFPNTRPWEMLGLSEQPTWWEDRYGPAPYTSDNLVLWDDLEAGYVADPLVPYVRPEYIRSGLTQVIPSGTEGELLSPLESVVGFYDPLTFRKSWTLGDGGPAEAAWWTSSSYPFAVMRLLALTRPSEFFSLFADRDLYRYDNELNQYLYSGRYRLTTKVLANQSTNSTLEIYGNGTSKASYINWIVDYNQQLGRNSSTQLTSALRNIDVRLCYRMASFTDKQYLKIYTERSSPDSVNSGLLLPDESYNLLLYKNQPFAEIVYSALIIERTTDGYAVFGYSATDPYFNIFASAANGVLTTVSAGGASVRVPVQYTDTVVQVPYGYVFTNTTVVVDFILSYGAYLKSQGLIFDDRENGYTLNWNQMAQEFLYFSQQGWATGTMINLNPTANKLIATRENAVVDTIISLTPENMLLDQNRAVLPTRDLVIERLENTFSVTSQTNQTISYLKLRFTSYENMVVLDNLSIFNDLIYNPTTAARQNRIRVVAATTTEWNGTLDAQGFILNQDNIREWQPNRKYTKGEIVLYKGTYWSAQTIVQPTIEFNYNDWVKSDYTQVQKGLLPNLANKANQLANSYSINTANLERDNDLLSYGLIGFRPRPYMTALNLDDVSQVNIYQQFLGSKGTIRSAEIFNRADLGKESAEYNIFENWGILVSTYGANANRSFFELRLNEALLSANPSTVQVIEPQQSSLANQTVLLNDIWRESYNLTSTNILPTTYDVTIDTALPSAGYVNINDTDINVFNLDDPSSINASIDSVGIGTIIWVAKSNSYDWNIYRCEKLPGQVTQVLDNLNGTSVVQFTQAHNLSVGDLVILRYINSDVDGVYQVLSIPSITGVVVAFNFANTNQTSITVNGLGFYLQSARVAQASDVAALPYVNLLTSGAKAWVDNNGAGLWEVLEKQNPFTEIIDLAPETNIQDALYGSSIAQTVNNFAALVGSPGYTATVETPYVSSVGTTLNIVSTLGIIVGMTVSGTGYVSNQYVTAIVDTNTVTVSAGADSTPSGTLTFSLNIGSLTAFNQASGQYTQSSIITLNSAYTAGFGNSVQFGNQTWAVVGASESNNNLGYALVMYLVPTTNQYIQSQLLIPTNSVGNAVIGSNVEFGQSVTISQDERWLYVGAPEGDSVYAYGRVDASPQSVDYRTDGSTTTFNYSDDILIDSANPDQLLVTFNSNQLTYGVEYTIDSTDVIFAVAPADNYPLTISRRESTQLDNEIYVGVAATGGSGSAATFTVLNTRGTYNVTLLNPGTGYTVGNTLTISGALIGGASPANNITITVNAVLLGAITGISFSGSGINNTPTFDLAPTLFTATNIYSFSVLVNGVLQRPFIDYTFNNSTVEITFITIPAPGASIVVRAGVYWKRAAKISGPAGSRFGFSVSTTTDGRQIMIGAPDDTVTVNGSPLLAGTVQAYDRSVIRYQVDDVDQDTYAIPGTPVDPISVLLNGVFLINTELATNGQFSIVGSDVVLESTVELSVGDILEIETNEFQLVQSISANTPFDEADFGHIVDICPTNCSVYIGAPLDGSELLVQAGSVDRRVNQSRVYGVTSSLIANPTLTAGDTIRINNVELTVPNSPNNTVAKLVDEINNYNNGAGLPTGIPNVMASTTTDLTFVGNGTKQIFDIGTLYSDSEFTVAPTSIVYVDNVLQTPSVDYTLSSNFEQILFVVAPALGSEILVISGRMTISVKNSLSATPFNKLTVLPGVVTTGISVFDALGFNTYAWTQTIVSPNPSNYANFGSSLSINSSAVNLVVGAPNGNVYEPVTFDQGLTYFDDRSTTFFTPINNGGVVYTYDYLDSASQSITDAGQFAFGQQIFDTNIMVGNEFGKAVNYVSGRLLVGSPAATVDSQVSAGRVDVFDNPENILAWKVIHQQQPVVDVDLINSVFCYDRLTSTTQTYFDFFDPLQGKILGAARRNIDYIGAVDPADYNVGTIHNLGNSWAQEHVGEIWWDTDSVRFIDPNQDDIVYASRRWGQTFPGSRVDIYQWISSSVPPIEYLGPGIPLSTTSYTVSSRLNQQNIFETRYYFWVRGISTIETGAGKTLSTTGIARYIENPRSSGIPYVAGLNASTVAIYNATDLISAADTILHIEYDRQLTDACVHQEYQLIADGKPEAFLNDVLYRKLQDSFCGVDTRGGVVPDPLLSPAERYGVQFRPRQSMFVDRFTALENYLGRANTVLAQYPIVESRRFNLLDSAEPEPPSTVDSETIWNKRVVNLEELGYQNINSVALGYLYLVATDSSQFGFWTIYEVATGSTPGSRVLNLVRVQNYDTRRYWYHIDWYQPGYNNSIQPIAEVPVYSALDTLSLISAPIGSSVRVTANAQGKWEVYLRTDLEWTRVGLQDGTIQFNEELWNYAAGNFGFDVEVFDAQYFDQEPVIETRKIIQAINEELFIDELAIERNQSLILMFNYIYSEFSAPEWLTKTSLVDATHRIRALLPYQTYLQDNQDFVLDYIQEVKPYHVQIREFNLTYDGQDSYPGMVTDFDVPAYFNTQLELPQFVSPVLTPYTLSGSIVESTVSDEASNADIWSRTPWNEWYNNYLLGIQGVTIVDGGAGYSVPPEVVVSGECVEPAEMTAIINSAGQVVGVDITNPGNGYQTTAIITFIGGNGLGAKAVAIMGNDLIRNIKTTIKYDRYQYTTTIVDWQPNVSYDNGTQVRYVDQVWSANSDDSTAVESATFDPANWLRVPASTLSGVDRTMGFYSPTVNMPGLDLPLIIDGIDYPGVQVYGLGYTQDIPLDVMYQSSYLDLYLGTRYTDINVSGGEYISPYASHAPEELVPGAEFDTMDFRVYTTPGADWANDGHGFPEEELNFVYNGSATTQSFANLLPYITQIVVSNQTTGSQLILDEQYTVDWTAQTVTVTSGASENDIIVINAYEFGGGNQLYKNIYLGTITEVVDIPVVYSNIQELAVFINGRPRTDYLYAPLYSTVGVDATYSTVGSSGTTLVVSSTIDISVGSLITGSGFTGNQTVVSKVNGTTLLISAVPNSTPDGVLTFYANTGSTQVTFNTSLEETDAVTLVAIGPTTINDVVINYSWSTPVRQTFPGISGVVSYPLTNSTAYTNPDNLIVTVNGTRARTSAGVEYYSDDSTAYLLPQRLGFSQSIIADNQVHVYLNDIPQQLNVDFTVEPYDPLDSGRSVILATLPPANTRILVTVDTNTQCFVNAGSLIFNSSGGLVPSNGDSITVTTWNDTRQQDILTEVFVGPVTIGTTITESFDETNYDPDFISSSSVVLYTAAQMNLGVTYTIVNVNTTDFTLFGAASNTVGVTFVANWVGARPVNGTGIVSAVVYLRSSATDALSGTAGTFDYSAGSAVTLNNLILSRPITDPSRLWVTLNGLRQFYGADFTIEDQELVLNSGILRASDVVMITEFTNSVTPEAMAFRIFQDMRGTQATYRITPNTTTTLVQPVAQLDDIIYVADASRLAQPNVEINIWGVVTIDGERIMYRERNVVDNTISSLLRGTAGTGATEHEVDAAVYDMGRGNLLPIVYQNRIISDTTLANGTETVFYANSIDVTNEDSTVLEEAIEVYVGGARVLAGYSINTWDPVSIIFDTAPSDGVAVTILVRRGSTWYAPGSGTPSNGVALQDTNTIPARFLRGL